MYCMGKTGFIPIGYHPCLVDEENLVPGLIFVVTFRIFTAGKEARRLMALAQALAKKPSLQRACFPDHVCRPKPPSKPDTWKISERFYFCHQNLKDHFSHGRLTADRVFVTKISLFGHKSCGCSSQVGGWRAATDVDTWPRWRGEVALPAKCQHLRGKKAFIYLPITACSLLPLPSSSYPWRHGNWRESNCSEAHPPQPPLSPLRGLAPYTPKPSGPNHTPYARP